MLAGTERAQERPRSGPLLSLLSAVEEVSYPVGQGFAWSPLLKLFHRVNGVLPGPG